MMLPEVTPLALAAPAGEGEVERNVVFQSLVKEDGDITGLVAYSIYKQNKLDWLIAFEKARGRPLATYRQLADATLAGGEAPAGAGKGRTPYAVLAKRGAPQRSWLAHSLIGYVILAVAILAVAWLVVHFGQPKI
jgi:hypothetical protein